MGNKNNQKHTLNYEYFKEINSEEKAIFKRGNAYYIHISNKDSIEKMFNCMCQNSSVFLERKFLPFKNFLYKI